MRITRRCSVDGCEAKHYGRGYCQLHWWRWRRYGDALVSRPRGGPRKPARPCHVPDCWRAVTCKNLCSLHYGRMMREELKARIAGQTGLHPLRAISNGKN